MVKQLNEWGRALSNEDRTNLTKDDAGTNRLLIGYQEDGFDNGNVGAKMSRVGVDVVSADANDLTFSTDFNLMKVIAEGETEITKTASSFIAVTNLELDIPEGTKVHAWISEGPSQGFSLLLGENIPTPYNSMNLFDGLNDFSVYGFSYEGGVSFVILTQDSGGYYDDPINVSVKYWIYINTVSGE